MMRVAIALVALLCGCLGAPDQSCTDGADGCACIVDFNRYMCDEGLTCLYRENICVAHDVACPPESVGTACQCGEGRVAREGVIECNAGSALCRCQPLPEDRDLTAWFVDSRWEDGRWVEESDEACVTGSVHYPPAGGGAIYGDEVHLISRLAWTDSTVRLSATEGMVLPGSGTVLASEEWDDDVLLSGGQVTIEFESSSGMRWRVEVELEDGLVCGSRSDDFGAGVDAGI